MLLLVKLYLLFLLVSFLFLLILRSYVAKPNQSVSKNISPQDITTIIPFRDEEENLKNLLECIRNLEVLPAKIIFINDHSTDRSEELLIPLLSEKVQLITLDDETQGKKAALKRGMEDVHTKYVHTMDADVLFSPELYNNIGESVRESALIALPVFMEGNSYKTRLFSLEFNLFNAFNYLLSILFPLSINGANLIFNSEEIDYREQLKKHKNISSGDDYFLLKYVRNKKLEISYYYTSLFVVKTLAPTSFRAYFDQRVRWIKKSSTRMDGKELLVGVYFFFYFIVGFFILVMLLYLEYWNYFIILCSLKFIIDSFVYSSYIQRIGGKINFLLILFFQFYYPLCFMFILVSSLFYYPKWKNRRVLN